MSLVRVATAVAALAVVLAPGAAAQARGSTANGPTQQTAAAAESTDTTDTTAAVPPILAQRRDVTVTSFDGTGIAAHVFPAPGLVAGATAPTVLTPPGWGQPGYTDPATARRFTDQGYNVVTWDPRGFGTSGGTVEFNSPAIEGRDTSAIIDWVATQPWAQLDRPGDPRVGMSGGSYGGSIQYSTAANDHRLDALVPTVGWFSLATSLYKNNTVKQAWFDSLYMGGYGAAAEVPPGLDPQLAAGFVNGSRTGVLTPAEISWLAERGPGSAAENITTPTMIIGGTVDTLFPLDEQIELYRTIRKGGAPVKMVWMCGGHGICSTGIGDPGDTEVHSLSFDSKYV
ncbi:S9 family peptidase, partial [Frankia sp. EI5c]|uniref:alpha/beta hydrolase family protein n=1 Tax=Frankia sp. EI5c TaxID=683316 RepID=UPI001A7E974F